MLKYLFYGIFQVFTVYFVIISNSTLLHMGISIEWIFIRVWNVQSFPFNDLEMTGRDW